MKKSLFIILEGGLVQNIFVSKDLKNLKAIVIDFDIEGADEKEITKIGSKWKAYANEYSVNIINKEDEKFFKTIIAKLEE